MLLKNIDSYISTADEKDSDENDVMSDIRYICKSCSLITEALQKGSDVLQLPNGDIVISELKTVTFKYSWDEKKGKLVRTQSGAKHRKPRVALSKKETVKAEEAVSAEIEKETV
jgi:uncharacterized protein DUF2671